MRGGGRGNQVFKVIFAYIASLRYSLGNRRPGNKTKMKVKKGAGDTVQEESTLA